MQPLNFPDYSFRTGTNNGQNTIFDPIRKRYVALTPEEWVRQNLICFLTEDRGVPLTLLASERGLMVNGLNQRFDLVVFAKNGAPLMIGECKAPSVKLSEETFHQAIRYNITLKAHFLLISNGLEHHIAFIDYSTAQLKFLPQIPTYQEMLDRVF